jgi:hypothetical protein
MAEKKLFLPLTQAVADAVAPPTVDSMRKRLGGRVSQEVGSELGSIVTVTGGVAPRIGVILASSGARCDVFLERGLVKRTSRATLSAFVGAAPLELSRVAEQATVFGQLFEGQSVHVERSDGAGLRGILREKCRYGALVETNTGTLLGVGFQRLWPAPQDDEQS